MQYYMHWQIEIRELDIYLYNNVFRQQNIWFSSKIPFAKELFYSIFFFLQFFIFTFIICKPSQAQKHKPDFLIATQLLVITQISAMAHTHLNPHELAWNKDHI